MTHSIAPGGPFVREAAALIASGFVLRWQSQGRSIGGAAKKNKVTYTCPSCGQNAWAKPGARLVCGECMEVMGEPTMAGDGAT